jgi:hypothetical protein
LIAASYRDTVVGMARHLLSPAVMRAVAALVFGCTLLILPARARAQDASGASNALGQGFGAQGQLVISGEDFFGFAKENNAGWRLTLQPSVDYFVVNSISAGAVAAFIMGNNSYKEELIGVRGGFNVNVMEHLSAWAKVGIAYDHISLAAPAPSFSTTWLTAYLPIMYHIVPHLFVGVGPYYNLKITGDGNTGYGFSSLVGGWF